jgi:competence protein ComEA
MKWRQFVKDYLVFSKKERTALIGVIIIVLTIVLLPLIFSLNSKPVSIEENDLFKNVIDSSQLNAVNIISEPEDFNPTLLELSVAGSYENASLFYFDPNTLSTEGWKKLGLNERSIKTIKNYTNKGGRFYKPEDLKKIWGLDINFYNRVKEHIVIPQKENIHSANNYQKLEKKPVVLDVNTADSSELITLSGIGPRLSARIISFRDKLGGFYSVDQIAETYGLPDSTFQKIKRNLTVNQDKVKKINLNTSTKDQFRSHPYINWNIANAIVEYKNQHGDYKSIDEVKKIALINDEIFNKISPYLTLNY